MRRSKPRLLLVKRYDEYRKADETYIGHLAGIIVRKSGRKWQPIKNGVIRVEPTMRWRSFINFTVSFPAELIDIKSSNPLFNNYLFIPRSSRIFFLTRSGGKLINYDEDIIRPIFKEGNLF